MDAGSIWYSALSNAGRNIAQGIQTYRQQQEQYDMIDQMVTLGSQMSVEGPDGQEKPLIDPKMLEMWGQKSKRERMHSLGAMEALMKVGTGLAYEGARARIRAEKTQPIPVYDSRGRQIGERVPGQNTHIFPQWVGNPEGKRKASQYDKDLAKFGLTSEDLTELDPTSLQIADKSGYAIPHVRFGKDDNIYENIGRGGEEGKGKKQGYPQQWVPAKREGDFAFVTGTVGDKQFKIPFNKWRSLMNMRKEQAQQSQDGGGEADNTVPFQAQQPPDGRRQIPTVQTAAEAWKLPPGTLFRTPDGRILRVPTR